MNRESLVRLLSGKASRDVDIGKLIHLIFEYFGEEDGELVLRIALFFKQPGNYQWLGHKLIERLEEELE